MKSISLFFYCIKKSKNKAINTSGKCGLQVIQLCDFEVCVHTCVYVCMCMLVHITQVLKLSVWKPG